MESTGSFQTNDGLQLFTRQWTPPDAPKACLILTHGYGEHSGRYEAFARVLVEQGIALYTYDLRGHGESPGKRGYIRDFNQLLNDLDGLVEHVRPEIGNRPLFYMGHSMGGLVLARYTQTRPLEAEGLIFSGSLLAIDPGISPMLIALAGVLGTLTPWLPVARVESEKLARDPAVPAAYDNDPLVYHGSILARTGAQLQKAVKQATAQMDAIRLPIYIFHGAEDRLAPPQGSVLLHDRAGSKDKVLRLYERGYHEQLNDLDREVVMADLLGWIEGKLRHQAREFD